MGNRNVSIQKNRKKLILPAWEAVRTRGDFSVLIAVLRGKFDLRYPAGLNSKHLTAAMEWLCRAQDATPDDGVAGAYDIVADRWYPSYPETTGYIIPTFYDYASYSGDQSYRIRALRMAEWLLSLQEDNGAFPGPPWLNSDSQPYVFDTGQIIHGLIRAYKETDEADFFEAARRAGNWLVEVQDDDGSWRKFDMELPHVYNARTAWALLLIDRAEKSSPYTSAAIKNLDWVLRQQTEDGWFQCAAFEPQDDPLTHTLAYTIEGLFEAGTLLADQSMIDASCRAADALRRKQQSSDYLAGKYGSGWQNSVSWSCLTGNTQMALIWLKFFELTGDRGYLQAAVTANRGLRQVQSLTSRSPGIRGGISGSYPIYGEYGHYLFLNWAAKFFADSLMLEDRLAGEKW